MSLLTNFTDLAKSVKLALDRKADKSEIPVIPELATVATSGSYNDLSNTPTIPTAGTITSGSTGYATGGDVYTAIGNIPQIPVGTNTGDILVWNGYDWVSKPYYSTIYQRCEYIENLQTTAQANRSVIELPIPSGQSTFTIKAKIKIVPGYNAILSPIRANYGHYYLGGLSAGFGVWIYSARQANVVLDEAEYDDWIDIEYSFNGSTITNKVNGQTATYNSSMSTTASLLTVFARYDSGYDKGAFKLKELEATVGTQTKVYYPVYNRYTGAIGLLDPTTMSFYGNVISGSVPFSKGPDV